MKYIPGDHDFDWESFLTQTEYKYSKDDLRTAFHLVIDWAHCACGQLCGKLPKGEREEPLDRTLYQLGVDFAEAIETIRFNNNYRPSYDAALVIFNQIKQRTHELLHCNSQEADKENN